MMQVASTKHHHPSAPTLCSVWNNTTAPPRTCASVPTLSPTSNYPSDMMILKPFFIMDWLEDLTQDQDLFQLSQLLKTPSKKSFHQRVDSRDDDYYLTEAIILQQTPKSSNRKKCFGSEGRGPTSSFLPALPGLGRSRSESPVRPKLLSFGGDTGSFSTTGTVSTGESDESADREASEQQEENPSEPVLVAPPTIRKTTRKPKSPHSIYRKSIALGNAWNAKGLSKAQANQWVEAVLCWDNALEIRTTLLGRFHGDVANTLNNRGIALGKLKKIDEAIDSLEQALEIRWKLFHLSSQKSPPPETILSTLHNLANVYQQAQDLEQALQVYGQAREMGVEFQAKLVPRARTCAAMGHLYCQAQQWGDARDAFMDARDLYLQERQALRDGLDMQTKSEQDLEFLESALLTTQQELADVERELDELDRQRLLR